MSMIQRLAAMVPAFAARLAAPAAPATAPAPQAPATQPSYQKDQLSLSKAQPAQPQQGLLATIDRQSAELTRAMRGLRDQLLQATGEAGAGLYARFQGLRDQREALDHISHVARGLSAAGIQDARPHRALADLARETVAGPLGASEVALRARMIRLEARGLPVPASLGDLADRIHEREGVIRELRDRLQHATGESLEKDMARLQDSEYSLALLTRFANTIERLANTPSATPAQRQRLEELASRVQRSSHEDLIRLVLMADGVLRDAQARR